MRAEQRPGLGEGWTDIGAVTGGGVDLHFDEITEPTGWNIEVVVGTNDHPPATATEPCESCGQPVQLISVLPFIRALLGEAPVPEAMRRRTETPQWQEVHHDSRPGSHRVLYRPHTPELCRRVRAGDPDLPDFDEDLD